MRRIIASALAVVVIPGTATASIYARVQDSAPPSAWAMAAHEPTFGDIIIEETVDPADEALVDWATDRYREAGLSLPTIRLSFHADSSPCGGARGGHRIEEGVSRVYICVTELGATRALKVKRTLLHEFAHAWDHQYLTDDIRAAFMELHGLDGWTFDVPYEERGSGHATEAITWGLLDRHLMFGEFGEPTLPATTSTPAPRRNWRWSSRPGNNPKQQGVGANGSKSASMTRPNPVAARRSLRSSSRAASTSRPAQAPLATSAPSYSKN